MSHRTADLPPLTGIAHVIRELRYLEGARQGLAVVLVVLYTVDGRADPGARGDRVADRRSPARSCASTPAASSSRIRSSRPTARIASCATRSTRATSCSSSASHSRARAGGGCRSHCSSSGSITRRRSSTRTASCAHLRRGVGEVVRAHAGAHAALRRRAPRAPATGAGRSPSATAQRRDRVRRARAGLRGVDRVAKRSAEHASGRD